MLRYSIPEANQPRGLTNLLPPQPIGMQALLLIILLVRDNIHTNNISNPSPLVWGYAAELLLMDVAGKSSSAWIW